MDQTRRGWVVLGATASLLMVSAGLRWSMGGFIPAWQRSFHVDLATVSVVASLTLLVYGLAQPWIGLLVGRWGPRTVMAVGAATLGVGLGLSAIASNPWELMACFGVLGGSGFAALAQVSATAAVKDWFPGRRGLAIGIFNAGNSLGMLTIGPLSLLGISYWGWRRTDLVLGLGVLAVLVPLALGAIRSPAAPTGAGAALEPEEANGARWLGRPEFWRLAGSFFVCGFTTNGLMGPHFVGFLDWDGFSLGVTALAIGVMGGSNVLGALAAGYFSDRVQRGRLLSAIYATRLATLVLMLVFHSAAGILVLSAAYGFLDYATVPPTASLAVDAFGREGIRAFSWIFLAHQLGAAVSSWVSGVLFDWTHTYVTVFLFAASFLVGAAALTWGIRSEGGRALSTPLAPRSQQA